VSHSPDPSSISLSISDPHHYLESIFAFLHGQSLDVTDVNACELHRLGAELQLTCLARVIQPALDAGTNLRNAIPRLIAGGYPSALSFTLQNIEKIQKSADIYKLPIPILLQIINSDQATFSTPLSRHLFAFRCAVQIPDLIPQLFTKEWVHSLPIDSVISLVTMGEFSSLDNRVPYLFHSALKLMQSNADLRTEIDSLNRSHVELSEWVNQLKDVVNPRLEAFNRMHEENTVRLNSRIHAINRDFDKLFKSDFSSGLHELKSRPISPPLIADLQKRLESVEKLGAEVGRYINDMKVMLPPLRANAQREHAAWVEAMVALRASIAKLAPNEREIREVEVAIREVNVRSEQMQRCLREILE
jgi:hypothetical protein